MSARDPDLRFAFIMGTLTGFSYGALAALIVMALA